MASSSRSRGADSSRIEPRGSRPLALWDRYLTARRAEHAALAARIADAEAELNARVDALFGLTRDETALIAETLAGQY